MLSMSQSEILTEYFPNSFPLIYPTRHIKSYGPVIYIFKLNVYKRLA